MRIAFFADIHANLPAFEAALADAQARGATHLICLGDIVGYGPQPEETLSRVRAVANGCLMGNHDAAACGLLNPDLFNPFAKESAERASLALDAEEKVWLRQLPYILEIKDIACAHGGFEAPENFNYLETKEDAERNLAAMPNFALLVVGHTHIPCVFAQECGRQTVRKLPAADFSLTPHVRYVVTPGSIGSPRGDSLTADYLLYDTLTRRAIFCAVPYDLAPYRLAVVRNGYNPLNYWFLSPSARRRQTELAFRNPTHAATAPVGNRAPFRVRRHTFLSLPTTFWVISTLFLGLTLALLLLVGRLPEETPPAVHTQPVPADVLQAGAIVGEDGEFLPPLSVWALPAYATVEMTFREEENTLSLQPKSPPGAAKVTLLSPVVVLPEGARRLRLTFDTEGAPGPDFAYAARFLFIRADGTQRKDKLHTYKRPDFRSYAALVPAGAVAFRLEFSLSLPTAFSLVNPRVAVE